MTAAELKEAADRETSRIRSTRCVISTSTIERDASGKLKKLKITDVHIELVLGSGIQAASSEDPQSLLRGRTMTSMTNATGLQAKKRTASNKRLRKKVN